MSTIIVFDVPEQQRQDVLQDQQKPEIAKILGREHVNILEIQSPEIVNTGMSAILAKTVLLFHIPIVESVKSNAFGITLQLNYDIHALTDKKYKIAIGANTPFKMIGLKLKNRFIPNDLLIDELIRHKLDFVDGNYDGYMPYRNTNYFRIPILEREFERSTSSDTNIIFKNEQHANEIFGAIIKDIEIKYNYYGQTSPLVGLLARLTYLGLPKPISLISVKETKKKEIKKQEGDILVQLLGFQPHNTNPENIAHLLKLHNVKHIYDSLSSQKLTSTAAKALLLKRKQILDSQALLVKKSKEFRHERFETSELMNLAKLKYPNKKFSQLTSKELELLTKLRAPKNEQVEQIVKELSDAFDSMDPIKATKNVVKKHGTDIKKICKHLQEKVERITNSRNHDINLNEIDEYIKSEFCKETKPDAAEYYCDLCGQLISYAADEGEDFNQEVYQATGEVDPLREFIYHEVSYLIRSYLRFKSDIKVQTLIDSFAMSMYSEISNIEIKIKQIQTNITDDIKDLISVHIACYAFAMMSHFIATNYGKVTFAQRLNNPKQEQQQESIVEKSEQNDDDSIIERPKAEQKEEKEEKEEKKKEEKQKQEKKKGKKTIKGGEDQKEIKLRLQNILQNAYYLILMSKGVVMRRLSNINRDKVKQMLMAAYKWTISLKMYKTDTVGVELTIDHLKSNMFFIYMCYPYSLAGIKLPAIDLKSKDPFKELEPIDLTKWVKSGNDMFDKYTYGSYTLIFDYLEAYKTLSVPRSQALLAVDQKYEELLTLQKRLAKTSRFIYLCKPYQLLIKTVLHVSPNAYHCNYSRWTYFNEQGQLRKFDKFLMSNKKTYTIKELKELDWKTRKTIEFVDHYCSDAGKSKRDIKPNHKVDLDEVFLTIGKSKGFYEYFANKCPEGEVHEMIDGACKKCKLKANSQDPAYFKKYIHLFDKYLKAREDSLNDLIQEMLNSGSEIKDKQKGKEDKHEKGKEKEKEGKKYKYDEAEILGWSRITKRPFGALMNIGFSEGIHYDSLMKEKVNPAYNATEAQHKGRLLKLHSHLSTLRSDYNAIRTMEIFDSLPSEYKAIINTDKSKLKLPELDDNIDRDYRVCKLTQSYKITCNFVLNAIAKIIKIVNDHSPKLALAMTDTILGREKTMSKPSPFKIKVEKGDYNSSGSEASEAGTPVSADNISFSEDEERPQGDEFSLENTAITDLNNNDDSDD